MRGLSRSRHAGSSLLSSTAKRQATAFTSLIGCANAASLCVRTRTYIHAPLFLRRPIQMRLIQWRQLSAVSFSMVVALAPSIRRQRQNGSVSDALSEGGSPTFTRSKRERSEPIPLDFPIGPLRRPSILSRFTDPPLAEMSSGQKKPERQPARPRHLAGPLPSAN